MIKNVLLTVVAGLALVTSAAAADLPSKKTAPAKVDGAAAPLPTAAPDTVLTLGFGAESDDGTYNKANKYVYKLGVEKDAGFGFFIGGNASTNQAQPNDGALTQNLEGYAGYKLGMGPVAVKGSVGIGERFTTGNNFPYYVARVGADYKINDQLVWNAAQYRYRNAWDHAANGYESHQIGTGMTFNFTQSQAVYANIYRNLNSTYNVTDNGVEMGYKVAF